MNLDGALLEVTNLSFAYDGREVLREVSLRVEPGETIGVIGPNGSGKTTLLRLIAGILRPGSGEVRIHGQPIERLPRREVAKAVAVVPQEVTVVFPYTVTEIVLMGRSPHQGSFSFETAEDLEISERVMSLLEIDTLADRYISELSGGEKQRALIARALAQEPSLLLLDEPTSFLDLKHQVAIYRLLRKLGRARSGDHALASVVVSHNLNFASRICDRLLVLESGCVRAFGPPAEVLTPELLESVYGIDVEAIVGAGGEMPAFVAPAVVVKEEGGPKNES